MNVRRIFLATVGFAVLAVVVVAFQSLSRHSFHVLLMVGTGAAMLCAVFFSSLPKEAQRRAPVTRGSVLWVCRYAGLGLMWLGGLVAAGNRTGAMPTIPYAGAVLLLVGVGLLAYSLAAAAQQGAPADRPPPSPPGGR
jgi:drug/metabolite transporter (DMT)-like permease